MSGLRRAAFLDRDGVINVDHGYVYRAEAFDFVPGVLEAAAQLAAQGYALVVVTNQSGIGRGLYTAADFEQLGIWMRGRFAAAGAPLAGIYYCPHLPNAGCECRKPKPGMFRALERELGVSVAGAPYIGDRLSDVEAAEAVGARPLLVRTGTGAATEAALGARRVPVFDDLAAAAGSLLGDGR